ncbi:MULTISPECIES: hypothetical protein [unclassified Mameliella]|nr:MULTISPECIES: hypothetical protein [unclassified Mameliella]
MSSPAAVAGAWAAKANRSMNAFVPPDIRSRTKLIPIAEIGLKRA